VPAAGALEPPAGVSWQPDTSALQELASGQADHFAALERQQYGQLGSRQLGQQAEEQPPGKKQRRRRHATAASAAPAAPAAPALRAARGAPPSLAQLAAQLDGPGTSAGLQPSGRDDQHQQQPGQDDQQGLQLMESGVDAGRLERFNLFAEEEALAAKRKNPEVEVGMMWQLLTFF
jgi:hypothetical protein